MRLRSLAALAALLLFFGALTACGSDDDESSGATPDAGKPAADGGVFPVSVEHRFGTTTVPEEPQRVVSVGLTEQDVLLQLGIVPVAVTEWYGEQPDATWPWAHDLLEGAEPEVLHTSDGFEFEKIAALQPDLIVGTNAGMTKDDYEKLSQIAPTISSLPGSARWFSPWRDQVLLIAEAVGQAEKGQQIVDDVAARYAEVAAEHPEWEGLTATFSQGGPSDNQLYVYPDGLSTEFLTDLGFTMTPGLEKYAPNSDSQALISAENVGLIDADVIVFATESADMFEDLMDFSTVSQLSAVSGKRAVYTDEIMAGATYFSTPLSLTYLLDRLTPMLERATAGENPREYPA